MKKYIKFIFLFILLMPFFVVAKSYPYDEATIEMVNNYIKSDNYKNRDKFLILKNPVYFKYNYTSVGIDDRFKMGGLLNKDEYDLSVRNDNSYLATGIEYWTMTDVNSSSQYYVENYLKYKDKTMNSAIRVTEIVKHEVEVTGTGSYVNPWVFYASPLVTIRTNSKDYGKVDGKTISTKYATLINKNKYYANFKLTPEKGFEYEGHDGCRLVSTNSVEGANTFENDYRISNITDDMDCTVVFVGRTWKLILKSNEGYSKDPVPSVIYYKYKDGWYTNATLSNVFAKLTTLPARTGYSYEGYKFGSIEVIDKNGNLMFDRNATIFNETKNNNQNLIAQWKANEYTVTFNANGGSVNPSTKVVTFDSTYGELPTPTRVGYIFNGWIDENNANVTSTKIVKIPKNHTLKAIWTPITYSIAYTMENGTHGTNHPTTATYDTAFTLNTPTKSLKLTFSTTGTPASVNYSGAGVSGNNQSVAYTFNGWNISGMDTVTHYFGSATSTASSATGRKETNYKNLRSTSGTVTFNAKWAKVSVKLPQVSATGYTCKWTSDQYTWASGATYETSAYNGATARTFNASCTASTFTVSYNPNGGSGNMTNHTCTYDQACTLKSNSYSRTGYTFAGWKKDNSGTTYAAGTSIKNVVTGGTVTYYAQWTANTFTVSYNANGGSGTTSSHTCTYDEACTLSSNGYSRSGYKFIGWKRDNSGSTLGVGTSIKNIVTSGTVTYYAQWEEDGPQLCNFKLGDFVKFVPSKTSYTTDPSKTGYSPAETFNPSELQIWKIHTASNGTIEIINHYKPSKTITLYGATGYQNLTGYLNVLAKQYENPNYSIGSRHFGYDGSQYDYCSSVYPKDCPNTYFTSTYHPYEVKNKKEKLYENNGQESTSSYYVAFRSASKYNKSDNYMVNPLICSNSNCGISSRYLHDTKKNKSNSQSWYLRPVIVLKNNLRCKGTGTLSDPYTLYN